MTKKELTKYYSIKSLKESVIIFLICSALILLTLKFGESPISFLLKGFGVNIIVILIPLFLMIYFITYSINSIYNKMDIKSKEETKK